MTAPLCPDCQQPMVFKWDAGQYVCLLCRVEAVERFQQLRAHGAIGGLNWVDLLRLRTQFGGGEKAMLGLSRPLRLLLGAGRAV